MNCLPRDDTKFKAGKSRPVVVNLVSVLLVLILSLCSFESLAGSCGRPINVLEGKWAEHRKDEFIVQYANEGKHVLEADTASADDGVPDVVADAVTQLVALREMLSLLGFRLPLDSPRYREQGASHVLLRFRNLQRLNGRAFDEVRRLPTGECVLIIEVTSRYRSGNLTPAHEYFHQVQNGYTPFKRPWFYEGSARWSETILGKSVVAPQAPPEEDSDLQALWSRSYSAVSVWYGLIRLCDRQPSVIDVPDHLRAYRYRDGRPVLLDLQVPGHGYIRQVLESLETLGDQVTREQGLIRHRWPEKAQRDHRHDAAIWNTVRTTGKCS